MPRVSFRPRKAITAMQVCEDASSVRACRRNRRDTWCPGRGPQKNRSASRRLLELDPLNSHSPRRSFNEGGSINPQLLNLSTTKLSFGYWRGEKLVGSMKYRSIWSTSGPFASDSAFTSFHSGSAWKAAQFFSASARLGCSRM